MTDAAEMAQEAAPTGHGKLQLRILIGFLLGLGGGLAVHSFAADAGWVDNVVTYVTGPIGQIFLRLLFMLVIPLLVSALIVGVAAGALVIPFILNLLNQAFGFEGGPPAIVEGTQTLAAPQATLISALARGVIGGDLRWDLIGLGAAIGVVVIILDVVISSATKGRMKLPPLAVGIGFYLPAAVTTMLVIGAVAGWLYERTIKGTSFADVGRRMGVLLASGLIVGESLFGVLTAGVIVSTRDDAPFAMLPEGSSWPAGVAGVIAFFGLAFALYAWVRSRSAKV